LTALFTPSRRSALALSAGVVLLLAAVAPALGQSWRSDGAVAGFTAGSGFTGLTFRCASAGRVTVSFSGFPGRLQAGQPHTVVATVDDTAFVLDTIARDAGSGSILVAEGTLAARAPRGLDQATLFTTFPEIGSAAERAAFARVAQDVRLVRYGMDCYAYALLAAGQIDLVIEAGLHVYDVMAPIAVIEAAGGIVTNWQGGPAHEGGQVLAAANAEVHAAALARLNG
jgi:hypothetical protein